MNRTTTLIAAICAALALASCGKDEGSPIPAKRAATLERLLQQVQRQSDAGSCTTLLDTTIPALEAQAKRLPSKVGSDTRTTIQDGIAHLRDLAETDCTNKQQQELPTTSNSTETTTESTPSTTDSTESTTTDKTQSTDTNTTPSTDTAPSTDTTPSTPTPPGNGGTPTPGQGKVKKPKNDGGEKP
jgi:hypothetical protein